ncbi:MAG: Hsp20/alpha crystallin family protein [Anaerolineales bacterium]|nr:Hsp20/alpha crystallin family protein [Anaerolineales bacterium]
MTNMTRWNPLREMMNLRHEIDRLFEETMEWPLHDTVLSELALDLSETDEAYVVQASVPGIAPDDVEISITNNVLTITGEFKAEEETDKKQWHLRERRYGRFTRQLSFPTKVDSAAAAAEYANGILTLTVPKAEEVKPKRIAIKIGGNGHKVIEGQTS